MKNINELRTEISKYLSFTPPARAPRHRNLAAVEQENYTRLLVSYKGSEDDEIRAFLYIPKNVSNAPGILIHHQHNSEFNLGKSEVAGITGSEHQAFAPVLAGMGYVVLVPDRITFEDRRPNAEGIRVDAGDWLQHYNQFAYRLLNGITVTNKILEDATLSLNLLAHIKMVDANRLMVLGHSDGGNAALLQSALDTRIAYCCASGSVCSYEDKIKTRTGISMMLLIPGFMEKFEMHDLVKCVAPRGLLIVSADDDKYSRDADKIHLACKDAWGKDDARLMHLRYQGGHELDAVRFKEIVGWVSRTLGHK